MAITLEQAQLKLQEYLNTESAILTSQRYKSGQNIELERANLAEVRKGIIYWNNMVDQLSSSRKGARVRRVIPRDL